MTLFERVHMPSFAGATEWLNSEPLGPAASCDDGLIVIGVHTPEFSFEHQVDGVMA